jgi:hypothetical protein
MRLELIGDMVAPSAHPLNADRSLRLRHPAAPAPSPPQTLKIAGFALWRSLAFSLFSQSRLKPSLSPTTARHVRYERHRPSRASPTR